MYMCNLRFAHVDRGYFDSYFFNHFFLAETRDKVSTDLPHDYYFCHSFRKEAIIEIRHFDLFDSSIQLLSR